MLLTHLLGLLLLLKIITAQTQNPNLNKLFYKYLEPLNYYSNNTENENRLMTKVITTPSPAKYVINNRDLPLPKMCNGGYCVPYYLCENQTIITDGQTIIESRIDLNSQNSECHYLEICCASENQNIQSSEFRAHTLLNEEKQQSGCGYRHVNGIGLRIMNENNSESEFGEFPWMVAIIKIETIGEHSLKIYKCGGSLIHPQVVLTAAHCVHKLNNFELKVRVGEWDTQTNNEILPHQDRDVSEIIIHNQFIRSNLHNNIALLILDEAVFLTQNVQTVCLPPPNYVFDGNRCTASGWGKDDYGREAEYQVILKKVELPIISRDNCRSALRRTRVGVFFELHESFICAGGEYGIDTCKGDGGSPLICPIPGTVNRYYQAGIVAWGLGCGEFEIPGVYVNVAGFKTWIDQEFQLRELNSAFYTPQ